MKTKEVEGYVTCENAAFGGDPEPGVAKSCFCRWKPQISEIDLCANEAEYASCKCTGVIYFGTYKSIMEEKTPRYSRSVWG